MRFLLTGGAGYIGSHTCVSLLDAGHEVVVLDNFVNSCPEAIARVEKIAGKPITLYEGDCCDAAFVSSVFDKEHIDGVVHFAGLKAVGESVVELLRPIREESGRLLADKAYLEGIYREGARRAQYLASKTLAKVQRKVGFQAR